jgi:hypothetical protein
MACHAPSGNARDAVLSLKIIVNTVSYVESAELCFESHSTLTEKSLVNSKKNSEAAMNHSLYGADRRTHLKIVIIGLLCAIVVAAIGKFSHIGDLDLGTAQIVKAGQATTFSGALRDIR